MVLKALYARFWLLAHVLMSERMSASTETSRRTVLKPDVALRRPLHGEVMRAGKEGEGLLEVDLPSREVSESRRPTETRFPFDQRSSRLVLPELGGRTAVSVSALDVLSWSEAFVVFQTRVAPTAPTPLFRMSCPGAEAVQLPSRAWHFCSEPEKLPVLMPY